MLVPEAPERIATITWNIAAINNNPFEFWVSHHAPEYLLLMEKARSYIEDKMHACVDKVCVWACALEAMSTGTCLVPGAADCGTAVQYCARLYCLDSQNDHEVFNIFTDEMFATLKQDMVRPLSRACKANAFPACLVDVGMGEGLDELDRMWREHYRGL
eukprot:2856129-Rhodomonas_salina.1